MNPFRCERQTSYGSRLLYHSVLALCCQHLRRLTGGWSTEAEEHRRQAFQLLESAVSRHESKGGLHMLEPILVLFTLDVSGPLLNWAFLCGS